jgi:hypothetical protein
MITPLYYAIMFSCQCSRKSCIHLFHGEVCTYTSAFRYAPLLIFLPGTTVLGITISEGKFNYLVLYCTNITITSRHIRNKNTRVIRKLHYDQILYWPRCDGEICPFSYPVTKIKLNHQLYAAGMITFTVIFLRAMSCTLSYSTIRRYKLTNTWNTRARSFS